MRRSFLENVGGVRIAGLAYGDPARPPVVLLHGIRDHASSLEPIAEALAPRFHVLAPHLRGHGDSEKPGSYSMAELVADLRGLIRARGLRRPVLVGHSLGGQIVSRYAGLFDDVAALVCIEGLGPPRMGEQTRDGRRARLRERVEMLLEGRSRPAPLADLDVAIERFRRRNPRLSDKRVVLLVEQGTEPAPGGGVRWKWAPETQQVWTTFSAEETEELWTCVRCPVLVVTAAESASYWTFRDLASPMSEDRFRVELERKLALFPDVEHVVVPDAGHMVHYDQPDAVSEVLIDFLGRRAQAVSGSGVAIR